jgi:hypothetical protein
VAGPAPASPLTPTATAATPTGTAATPTGTAATPTNSSLVFPHTPQSTPLPPVAARRGRLTRLPARTREVMGLVAVLLCLAAIIAGILLSGQPEGISSLVRVGKSPATVQAAPGWALDRGIILRGRLAAAAAVPRVIH